MAIPQCAPVCGLQNVPPASGRMQDTTVQASKARQHSQRVVAFINHFSKDFTGSEQRSAHSAVGGQEHIGNSFGGVK
eukprot:3330671-Rhodomonas_salina.1